jgi:ABC-2 type transport system ATP-binding protein
MSANRDTSIRIDDLSFAYLREPVLRGVTFQLEKEAVGLLGPNGSGKTTLLRVLLGQVPVPARRVHVLGHDMHTQARRARARLGWMPERGGVIPGFSGVALVAYMGELAGMPRRDAMQRAHEVLHFVGLGDERYRKCETYSQGMRQRLKLATALVHDPDWLFLDEPTSGLDPGGRVAILELIRDLARQKGLGVILSTHLLADVEAVCREILVLRDGQLLARRPVDPRSVAGRQVFEVAGFGPEEAFQAALRDFGAEVETAHHVMHVTIDLDRLPSAPGESEGGFARGVRAILAIAARSGYAPRRLRPRPDTLSDQFHAMVREE